MTSGKCGWHTSAGQERPAADILIRVSPTLCSELPQSLTDTTTEQYQVPWLIPRNLSRFVPNSNSKATVIDYKWPNEKMGTGDPFSFSLVNQDQKRCNAAQFNRWEIWVPTQPLIHRLSWGRRWGTLLYLQVRTNSWLQHQEGLQGWTDPGLYTQLS